MIATGNSNANARNSSSARVAQAITVGATDNTDAIANCSNFGTCLDLFAPGVNIKSAWYTSNTATNVISGTSMAAPHVAGVATLYLQKMPTDTPAQVRKAIVSSATPKVTNKGSGSLSKLLFSRFGVLAFSPFDFMMADLPASTRERTFAS